MVLYQAVVLYQRVLYQGWYYRADGIEGVVLYQGAVLYRWYYTRGWYYRPDRGGTIPGGRYYSRGVVLYQVVLYQVVLNQYYRPDIEVVVLYQGVVLYQWCYTRGWYYRPDLEWVVLYEGVVLSQEVVLYQWSGTIDLILMGWYSSKGWYNTMGGTIPSGTVPVGGNIDLILKGWYYTMERYYTRWYYTRAWCYTRWYYTRW